MEKLVLVSDILIGAGIVQGFSSRYMVLFSLSILHILSSRTASSLYPRERFLCESIQYLFGHWSCSTFAPYREMASSRLAGYSSPDSLALALAAQLAIMPSSRDCHFDAELAHICSGRNRRPVVRLSLLPPIRPPA